MAQAQEGNSAGPGGDESALVVATRVGSLQQADVIRAALAGEGIPAIIADEGASNVLSYMGPAIHPWGIKVMVQAKHLPGATEIIKRASQSAAEDSEAPAAPSADDYAHAAYRSALFFWFFPPVALLTIYNLAKAIHARGRRPPEDSLRFNRRVGWAFLLGIVVPAIILALLLAAASVI